MKRLRIHRVVPAVLMAAATAIPVATTVEILAHVSAKQAITPATTAAAPPATPAHTTAPAATATPAAPAATATPAAAPRTYVGPVEYDRFGAVQATITVAGGKITAVAISAPEDDPRSADINTQAIPILQSETLQAQSASIDIVSGATYTSEAYQQSLQAALDQAHLS